METIETRWRHICWHPNLPNAMAIDMVIVKCLWVCLSGRSPSA